MKSQLDAVVALAIGFVATVAVQMPGIIGAHLAKAERIEAYEQAAAAERTLTDMRSGV